MGVPDSQAARSSASSVAKTTTAVTDSPARIAELRARADKAAAAAAARARGEVIATSPVSGHEVTPEEDEEDDDHDVAVPSVATVTQSASQVRGSTIQASSSTQVEAAAGRPPTPTASGTAATAAIQQSHSPLPPVSHNQINALTGNLAGGATMSAKPNASSTPNDLVKGLSDQLTCSICQEIVYQPVSVLDCLHTFCGSCLIQWISNHRNAPECPTCRSLARATKDSHQHNSLRDVLVRMDPSADRTEEEKAEMKRIYQPGSTIDIVQAVGASAPRLLPEHDSTDQNSLALQQQWQHQMAHRQQHGRLPGMRPMVLLNPIDELNLLLRFYFPCPTCEMGNPFGYTCTHPIPDPRLMYAFTLSGPAEAPPPIPRSAATLPIGHCSCFNCKRPNLMPLRDRRRFPQDVCAICSGRFCGNLLGYCGPIKQPKAREFKKLNEYTMPPRQGLLASAFSNIFGSSDTESISAFMPILFDGEPEKARAFDVWLQKQKNMTLNDFYHAVLDHAVRNSPEPIVVGSSEQGLLRARWQGVPGRDMQYRLRPTDYVCIICAKDLVEANARAWYNEELQKTPPTSGTLYRRARPASGESPSTTFSHSGPSGSTITSSVRPQNAGHTTVQSSGGFFSSIKKGFSDIGDKFNEMTGDTAPVPAPPVPEPLPEPPTADSFTDRQVLQGNQVPKYPAILGTSRDHDGHPVFLAIYTHPSGAQIPGKICPSLKQPVKVAWDGTEYSLTPQDKYETFLENPAIHKWIRVSNSNIPQTETPVQAGIERDGRTPLYFACAWHEGIRVPGYSGPNTRGACIAYGGAEVRIAEDYEVLVWRREAVSQ